MQKRLLLIVALLFSLTSLMAQKKFDSTMKVGRVGFRVVCNNKQPNKNTVTISPIGFETNMRDFGLEIKGRVKRCEVDDLNQDGTIDLLVFFMDDNDTLRRGALLGVANEGNSNVKPIFFPDIIDDPKLRDGYKGQDQFMLLEGILVRRYPLYTPAAEGVTQELTGKMRQIMYRVTPGENGAYKFVVSRTLDYTKQ